MEPQRIQHSNPPRSTLNFRHSCPPNVTRFFWLLGSAFLGDSSPRSAATPCLVKAGALLTFNIFGATLDSGVSRSVVARPKFPSLRGRVIKCVEGSALLGS